MEESETWVLLQAQMFTPDQEIHISCGGVGVGSETADKVSFYRAS